VASERQGVVYFLGPDGDLSGLDLRTGKQVWRGHADIGKPRPGTADTPQLLLYEDVLIARNGSKVVSLLPRTGG
jgi:outer membrane protein assembly factor BamB